MYKIGDKFTSPSSGSTIIISDIAEVDGKKFYWCNVNGKESSTGPDLLHEDWISSIMVRNTSDRPGSAGIFFRGCTDGSGTPEGDFYKIGGFDITQDNNPGNRTARASDDAWLVANEGSYCAFGSHAIFDDDGYLDQVWFWFADQSSFILLGNWGLYT